ncbi:MAG: HAD-IA family hydrolase [Phycisphaerales bacterium]|nr:HAD-IA family hydrolase [Phycisphaerales bacterium]
MIPQAQARLMPVSSVRLVCFDLGGVLVRICRSWREGCERAGLPAYDDLDTPESRAARAHWAHQYQLGRIDCREFADGLSAAVGGRYTPAHIRAIHDAWIIAEYPGAGDLLRTLNETGLTTAVLSNTNHGHWARLIPGTNGGEFPSLGLVQHPHASHLLGLAKPDPAIFRAFESRTGIAPSGVLFFDDLEENVSAARTCGWRAEKIDHSGDTVSQIIEHLARHGVRV